LNEEVFSTPASCTLTGSMRMPGLPEVPAAEGMDIDLNGVISGLS
jgi:formate--tetrahydrofolate ligase